MKKQNPPHCWNGSKIQQKNRRKRQNRDPFNYSVIHVHLIGFLFVTTSRSFPHSGLITGFNRTGATSGAGTAYPSGAREFTPGFQWGSCYSIFSFMCMFCRSLFVLLYFFFWPLYCLYFFDVRVLITPLVSSNFSYREKGNFDTNTSRPEITSFLIKQQQKMSRSDLIKQCLKIPTG